MDKTEQELAEKLGLSKLPGFGEVKADGGIYERTKYGGYYGRTWKLAESLALWNLTLSLLQENAKLSADFQSWLRKFESGELDSEQVKEKDARIKELETALLKIRAEWSHDGEIASEVCPHCVAETALSGGME